MNGLNCTYSKKPGFLFGLFLCLSAFVLVCILPSIILADNKLSLKAILDKISRADKIYETSLKDVKAVYKEEVWVDKEFQRKELEYLERKFKRKIEAPDMKSPMPIKREYTFYMKDNKLRLDFKEPYSGKFKPLEIRPQKEKIYRFFYVGDSPSDKFYRSKGMKPGDLIQVQIEEGPGRYVSQPLVYLGIWTNIVGKMLSEELKGSNLNFVGTEKIDGATCYVIELTSEFEALADEGKERKKTKFLERRLAFVDPDIGYRVRKWIYYSPQNELSAEYHYKDFKKYTGDIFLPSKVEMVFYSTTSSYGKNVPVRKQTIKFQEIEVNHGLPDDVFVPPILPGTQVYDLMTGRSYEIMDKQTIKILGRRF
jgi:outer membrane lipoprotein-sorting protein